MTKKFELERAILGGIVTQMENEFINITELVKLYNDHNGTNKRLADWWKNNNTSLTDTILTLAVIDGKNLGVANSQLLKNANELAVELGYAKIVQGKNSRTYLHPDLTIVAAQWLSGSVSAIVVRWFRDNCVANRAELIDLTKEFTDAIKKHFDSPNYAVINKIVNLHLLGVKITPNTIREKIECFRNILDEQQLKVMNDVHNQLTVLVKHGIITNEETLKTEIAKMNRFSI
ncbi:KilA-N domain-containing protein [Shewanella algae]